MLSFTGLRCAGFAKPRFALSPSGSLCFAKPLECRGIALTDDVGCMVNVYESTCGTALTDVARWSDVVCAVFQRVGACTGTSCGVCCGSQVV